MNIFSLLASMTGLTSRAVASNCTRQCGAPRCEEQHRLFVLTDMSNEPDDQMSLVRLLTYVNEINIQGIAAVTSSSKNYSLDIDTIRAVVSAYGDVVDNADVPDWDPDGDDLEFHWFQYEMALPSAIPIIAIETLNEVGSLVKLHAKDAMDRHIILSIKYKREMGIATYRRFMLKAEF